MEKYKDISSVVDYVVKVIFKYNLNNYKSVKLLPEIKLITENNKVNEFLRTSESI